MKYELLKKEKKQLDQWMGEGFSAGFIDSCEEEAQFEAVPGYNRTLFILDGDIILACPGESAARLKIKEQSNFSGNVRAKCFGKFKGYCLSVEEESQGIMDLISLSQQQCVIPLKVMDDYSRVAQGFYCCKGYGVISFDEETLMIKEGEQVFLYGTLQEQAKVGVMGEGELIRTQIFQDRRTDAAPRPSEIHNRWQPEVNNVEEAHNQKSEKTNATFADFSAAIKISSTNFKIAKHILPFVKNNWYDKELKTAIHKIQSKYIAPLIWVLGLVIIMAVGNSTWSVAALIIAAAAWSVIDIFLVTPFVYFMVLPKPVLEHIIPLKEMTEEEREMQKRENEQVTRARRALKRY